MSNYYRITLLVQEENKALKFFIHASNHYDIAIAFATFFSLIGKIDGISLLLAETPYIYTHTELTHTLSNVAGRARKRETQTHIQTQKIVVLLIEGYTRRVKLPDDIVDLACCNPSNS